MTLTLMKARMSVRNPSRYYHCDYSEIAVDCAPQLGHCYALMMRTTMTLCELPSLIAVHAVGQLDPDKMGSAGS